jgi:8-amino-7-oxononanoate synthase
MAKRITFRHNDLNDLERKIKKAKGNIFIAVESIYSMDGDVCPLSDLVGLSEKYGATVILDEAHSTGVVGDHGSGIAVSTGLHEKIGIRIYTFGKAMGVHGACIAGSQTLQQYLINFARPFIYTTAMPPHSLVSIACAFDFLSHNITLQQTLRKRIGEFLGYVTPITNRTSSTSAIQTLILGDNGGTRAAAAAIQNKGFDVRPFLSPTVPAGSERLRICVHAFNTAEQVRKLASELLALSHHIIHT